MGRPRYNVVTATEHGTFIVNRWDIGVGDHLAKSGSCEPAEIDLFRAVIQSLGRDDPVVLDIGANIGIRSVCLGEMVRPRGRVHAFEAQRIVFNMLAGNIALNSLENVWCHHLAVGAGAGRIAIPQFDYTRHLSFGSVEFGPRQLQEIGQQRRHDPATEETVELVSIDGLGFPAVHFIKIDVEGMELDVLRGAAQTIRRDLPVIYVEVLKCDRRAMARWLIDAGYRLFPNDYNWLCLPPASTVVVQGVEEIRSEEGL
jgi:FkbM family methyltransferase